MPNCIVISEDPAAKLSITNLILKQPGWNIASQTNHLCDAARPVLILVAGKPSHPIPRFAK